MQSDCEHMHAMFSDRVSLHRLAQAAGKIVAKEKSKAKGKAKGKAKSKAASKAKGKAKSKALRSIRTCHKTSIS